MSRDIYNTIHLLNKANVNQWIGNFEEADKIYRDLINSQDSLSVFLKPTLKKDKKDLLDGQIKKEKAVKMNNDENNKKIKDLPINWDEKYTSTEKNYILKQKLRYWKYNLIISSRLIENIKLDLRGYPLCKENPNINKKLPSIIHSWELDKYELVPKEDPDLLSIDVSLKKIEKVYLHMEIDYSGLLRGTIFTNEENLKKVMADLHILLFNLGEILWGNNTRHDKQ